MTAPSSSLCFHEASQKFKEKEINEEEYYHNILAHCMGYLHDEDDDVPWPSLSVSSLEWDDPFAFAVECFMKRKDFVTGTSTYGTPFSLQDPRVIKIEYSDIAPFEDSFKAIANQDVRAIEEATTRLQDQHANFLRKILALRALQLRKAEVLKYCLDLGGFPYEAYFEDEADTVREEDDPLVFKVRLLSSATAMCLVSRCLDTCSYTAGNYRYWKNLILESCIRDQRKIWRDKRRMTMRTTCWREMAFQPWEVRRGRIEKEKK